MLRENPDAVNRAFSKQASHFDEDDGDNVILQDLRQQVYRHVDKFLAPSSQILELNAGTGLDALHFVNLGHSVHAIDVAEGMVEQHQRKIASRNAGGRWTVQRLSFTELHKLNGQRYDYIFSNFGGLNCIPDLKAVTRFFPALLNKGGFVTFVLMPPVCPWEIAGLLKGNLNALRRLRRAGTMALIEGERFQTWYHSVARTTRDLGSEFALVSAEGLAAVSPPPDKKQFPERHPQLYALLRKADAALRNSFPFNRCADHVILTFQRQ